MEIKGRQRVDARREQVWAALNDPETLKACIPGCQSLEAIADDRMKAIVGIKIGPITARFAGEVRLLDRDPPSAYRIEGEGQGGAAGFAKGGAAVRLIEEGGATLVDYQVEARVGGKIAQLGGGLIDATAQQMASAFFARLAASLAPSQADSAPLAAATGGPAPAGPLAARSAAPGRRAILPLAVLAAAVGGYLLGRGSSGLAGDGGWAGLAIGLLVVLVAGAGFLAGRSSPVVVLDAETLARLSAERRSTGAP